MTIKYCKGENGQAPYYDVRFRINGKDKHMKYSTNTYGAYAKNMAEYSEINKIKIYNWFTDNNDGTINLYIYDTPNKQYYTFIISKVDYYRVKNHVWSLKHHGVNNYVYTNIKNRKVYLHRFIVNPPSDKVIDHINGNGLDNRRSNLRVVTQHINSRNRTKIATNNSTGKNGVSLENNNGSMYYRAQFVDMTGNCKAKVFKADLYGENVAQQLAIEARILMETLDDNTKFDAEWKNLHPELY